MFCVVAIAAGLVSTFWINRGCALANPNSSPATANFFSGIEEDVFIPVEIAKPAPALGNGTWINSSSLSIDGLRGQVVLIEFWTFGCYNCRNTLPSIKRWDERYRGKGLTVIGVHTPETNPEKELEEVRNETSRLGIRYAVVTDNSYTTWRKYGVQAWPTIIVLDKQGRIRWTHVGEGSYNNTENVIQKLIGEKI